MQLTGQMVVPKRTEIEAATLTPASEKKSNAGR